MHYLGINCGLRLRRKSTVLMIVTLRFALVMIFGMHGAWVVPPSLVAQTPTIDALTTALRNAPNDTNKVGLLLAFG
jgi:hypothetical protein